jgi:hypothetical protein
VYKLALFCRFSCFYAHSVPSDLLCHSSLLFFPLQKHFRTHVVPAVQEGVLCDFTVMDSAGCEDRVVLQGAQAVRRPAHTTTHTHTDTDTATDTDTDTAPSQSHRQAPPRPLPLPLHCLLAAPHWQEVLAVCGGGITVYLLQLLVAAAACLLLALLFVPALVRHSALYAGHVKDPRLLGAVACLPPEPVLLDSDPSCLQEEGGEGGGWCVVQQRDDCPLPLSSLAADLLFTALLAIGLLATLLCTAGGGGTRSQQGRLKRWLDVEVPTAKDFTVEVTNPPDDATDPSEWFQFFNKHFGKVQNVTVTFQNKRLVDLLLEKRRLLRRFTPEEITVKQLFHKSELTLDESLLLQHRRRSVLCLCPPLRSLLRALHLASDEDKIDQHLLHMRALCSTNSHILSWVQSPVPPRPRSVYVTFEHQVHRRKCLASAKRFRGKHSLLYNK